MKATAASQDYHTDISPSIWLCGIGLSTMILAIHHVVKTSVISNHPFSIPFCCRIETG
jgi:hypothetical protein